MKKETMIERCNQLEQDFFCIESEKQAKKRWDSIAKPINGLGTLEKIVEKVAGIIGTAEVTLNKKCVLVFCADNGIVEEGVTQTDSSVTAVVSANMANGTASINRMAKIANADVKVIDVGVRDYVNSEKIISAKIRSGTRNFLKEPAMTEEEVYQAVQTGMEMVHRCKEEGYQIIATGEMGIGNTTTSAALISAYLGIAPELITGKGAGLSDSGLERKREVIRRALKQYGFYQRRIEKKEEVVRVLYTVGGLDIAAMAGVFLGGVKYQIPIVIDGVISAAAALTAYRLCSKTSDIMIASHSSKEPAARAVMEELQLEPMIYGNLALGEGSGAVLLFPMLDMALEVYNENATFEQTQITAYKSFEE